MTALPRLLLPFACAAATLAFAAEPAAKPPWPLWDGQESIEQYAQRANLPPTKTLDLGNGVTLELVLIPAGEFLMGTPVPQWVNQMAFLDQMFLGLALLTTSVGVLLVLLGAVIIPAIRRRRRPQYSLVRFMVMMVVAAAGVFGGVHWWQSGQMADKANTEYQAALARYCAADAFEKPARKVTITTPFYIGKYEVTQEQYQQVTGTNPSTFKGKNNPVETVSWDDAQAFCKKLTEQTTQAVRLPTEAEWEYACRAGTTTTYHSGDAEADLARVAWNIANSKNKTHPVGQKEANAFGLFDMHGNVWQWCQDWYGEDYYGKSEAENPLGPPDGANRVLRGGSWFGVPVLCRSAFRLRFVPGYRDFSVGFRVVVWAPRTP